MAHIRSSHGHAATVMAFTLFLACAVFSLFGLPKTGYALEPRATPSTSTIVPGLNNTVQIRYTSTDPSDPDFTSTSDQGRFLTEDGRLLGTVDRRLAMRIRNGRGSVTELLTVPAGVIAQALKLKLSRIRYTREFRDAVTELNAVAVILPIVPSSAGAFSLVRMALAFNQPPEAAGTHPSSGGRITVPRFSKGLQAFATLTYNGGGTLRGQWKVDGQILGIVTRQLNRGLREATISSPPVPGLPTYGTGLHKVVFEIQAPTPSFDEPIIYYFVTEAYTGASLGSLQLAEPREGEHVGLSADPAPRFAWQSAGEGVLYRFRLYAIAELESLPGRQWR